MASVKVEHDGYDIEVDSRYAPLALALMRCNLGIFDIQEGQVDTSDPRFTELIFFSGEDIESLAHIVSSQGVSLSIFSDDPTNSTINGSILVSIDSDGSTVTTVHVELLSSYTDVLISALDRFRMSLVSEVIES